MVTADTTLARKLEEAMNYLSKGRAGVEKHYSWYNYSGKETALQRQG